VTRLVERVAKNLRDAREAAGLSREKLAQKADVSTRTIYRLERGETTNPRPDEFEKIAAALGMTSDELRGISDDEPGAADDALTLGEVQRRLAEITGSRDVAFGFVRVAANRARVDPGDWAMIELAIKAANKRLPEDDTDQPD
jgi:transcriptional regulator with XRE-family HTH domain